MTNQKAQLSVPYSPELAGIRLAKAICAFADEIPPNVEYFYGYDNLSRLLSDQLRLRFDLSTAECNAGWKHHGELQLRPSGQPALFIGRLVLHKQFLE